MNVLLKIADGLRFFRDMAGAFWYCLLAAGYRACCGADQGELSADRDGGVF